VADLHAHLIGLEAQLREQVDRGEDALGVGDGRVEAEDVDVPLPELPATAFLRSLGAAEVGRAEPLDRLGELRGLRGDHARERGRELGADGHLALAAVGKVEQLVDDALAALDLVEVERLEDRPVDLLEAVADGDAPPRVDEVIPPRHVAGVVVARAFGSLELGHGGHRGGNESISRFAQPLKRPRRRVQSVDSLT
jgi:hypothetical protein